MAHLWYFRIMMIGSRMAQQGESALGLLLELLRKKIVFPPWVINW